MSAVNRTSLDGNVSTEIRPEGIAVLHSTQLRTFTH
jgi:hypothetical protein